MNQVTGQIEREKRKTGERNLKAQTPQELIEKLQRLEKVLYSVRNQEKQMRWAKCVRKLNQLDHSNATRAFYSELKRKHFEQKQLDPIVNEKGVLSTSLKECMTNWRH